MYTMEDQDVVQVPRRRRHSAEFKAEAVSACMLPGVSIAAVALHYRVNANLLRRWIAAREAKQVVESSTSVAQFVPVPLVSPAPTPVQEIVVELRRGTTAITMRWPVSAAHDCAQWLQGWLR
jgi:transposase-like protein